VASLQAITDTVTQRQNITNAQKYLSQMTVSLQTNLLVAAKVANATVRQRSGDKFRILIRVPWNDCH